MVIFHQLNGSWEEKRPAAERQVTSATVGPTRASAKAGEATVETRSSSW